VYVLSDSVNGALKRNRANPGEGRGRGAQRWAGSLSVRAQICRQRTLLICVLVSHAAMHSGMFLPVAPGTARPPELSIGTGARALGSAAVGSRVAAGSVMAPDVELGIVAEVADPGTVSPLLDPAGVVDEPVVVVVGAVVEVVGCTARPVAKFGSAGVAKS
jgi:hypothetical protein